jgi:hypothetical protein
MSRIGDIEPDSIRHYIQTSTTATATATEIREYHQKISKISIVADIPALTVCLGANPFEWLEWVWRLRWP